MNTDRTPRDGVAADLEWLAQGALTCLIYTLAALLLPVAWIITRFERLPRQTIPVRAPKPDPEAEGTENAEAARPATAGAATPGGAKSDARIREQGQAAESTPRADNTDASESARGETAPADKTAPANDPPARPQ